MKKILVLSPHQDDERWMLRDSFKASKFKRKIFASILPK